MSESGRTHTVAMLAQFVGGTVRGAGATSISGFNLLDDAGPAELTFLGDAKYARRWAHSRAAAAIISEKLLPLIAAGDSRPLIVVPNADWAIIQLLQRIETPAVLPAIGVHPTAAVHPSAALGARVRVGPHVSIDQSAQVGDDVVLHAGVRLYADVVIGAGATLHANVVVRQGCRIGRGAILHQNVSIGSDGFGYRPNPQAGGLAKIPHIGNVIIEDDVELGANTCVDRGKFGPTVIGAGTKIDNLCQIGHNCRIGRHCTISGQSGLAGSVLVGDGVQIGGQVGVSDHVQIGARARIGGGSSVFQDVPAGATWVGYPAADAYATKRQWALLKQLPELLQRWRGKAARDE